METVIGVLFFIFFVIVPFILKLFKGAETGTANEEVGLEARLEEAIRQAKEEVERRKREAVSKQPPRVEPVAAPARPAVAATMAPPAPPRPAPRRAAPPPPVPRPAAAYKPPPQTQPAPRPILPLEQNSFPQAAPATMAPVLAPFQAATSTAKLAPAAIKGAAYGAQAAPPRRGLSLGRSELRRMTIYREILGPPRAVHPHAAPTHPAQR